MLNRPSRHANFLIAATALALTALAHAQTGPPPVAEVTMPPTPTALVERLVATMPTTLPGWTLGQPPMVCDPASLASALPQDAALAATYDFRWGVVVRLAPPEPEQPVEVRVLCMGEDLDAFGMLAHYRTDKTSPGPTATQSLWAGDDLHVWRGFCYLHLLPAGGGKQPHPSVVAAAEAVAAQLPLPGALPAMMRLMPQVRNLPFGLRYYRHNALGANTPGDGLVDTYLEADARLTLVLLRAPDETAATTLYDTMVGLLGGGVPCTPVDDVGKAAVRFVSAQHGQCYVMYEGRYVAMALGVHERPTAESLLRLMGTSIRISRF
jgi:hypothetical protein